MEWVIYSNNMRKKQSVGLSICALREKAKRQSKLCTDEKSRTVAGMGEGCGGGVDESHRLTS